MAIEGSANDSAIEAYSEKGPIIMEHDKGVIINFYEGSAQAFRNEIPHLVRKEKITSLEDNILNSLV